MIAKRRAPKQRRTGWLPTLSRLRRGIKNKPFLAPLPDHSVTAIMSRVKGTPRKRRLIRRTFWAFIVRWRYLVSMGVTLSLLFSGIATAMVLGRDAFNDSNKSPALSAPSLNELNQAIALGERFVGSLYKPLSDGTAVQSEASGMPLRAHFLDEDTWVLLGEDKTECSTGAGSCKITTSIRDVNDKSDRTTYTITFSTQTKRDALVAGVDIRWAYSPTEYRVTVDPSKVGEKVELWLDTSKLATFTPDNFKKSAQTFKSSEQSRLRMLRFTTRHATHEAYLYWSTYGKTAEEKARAKALGAFLDKNGFQAGFDLRAPLFNLAKALPDNMPVNEAAYPDCDVTAAGSQLAYAYRSKVCLYRSLYIISGERDPFLEAWAALTILTKYDDPNHEQPEWGWWTQGDTPQAVATHLQGQWNRTGYGMPKCTPFSCAELSSIRTSVFGALETKLGYTYGVAKSQKFADAAAKAIVLTQVGLDGKFTGDNGITYYRPGQVGSFLGAWLAPKYAFTQPSTPRLPVAVALWLKDAHATPLEYDGVIPSNSETSLDALGFLRMYRCAAYQVC